MTSRLASRGAWTYFETHLRAGHNVRLLILCPSGVFPMYVR